MSSTDRYKGVGGLSHALPSCCYGFQALRPTVWSWVVDNQEYLEATRFDYHTMSLADYESEHIFGVTLWQWGIHFPCHHCICRVVQLICFALYHELLKDGRRMFLAVSSFLAFANKNVWSWSDWHQNKFLLMSPPQSPSGVKLVFGNFVPGWICCVISSFHLLQPEDVVRIFWWSGRFFGMY